MAFVLSNKDNLDNLIKAVKALKKGEICISSGWIRSNMLTKVLTEAEQKIKNGNITVRVIIRIGNLKDVQITDPFVFSYLDSFNSESDKNLVQLRYSQHHHAKIYIIGNQYAQVGSFNLTGGGFGNQEKPGNNPEAGIETTDSKMIKEIQTRFDEMWEESKIIDENLLGFVSNGSEDGTFTMIGVREIAAGKFVQIGVQNYKTNEKETEKPQKQKKNDIREWILGKVEKSIKYNKDFFTVNEASVREDPRLFFNFANIDEKLNKIYGIASSVAPVKFQLNIGEVKVLYRIPNFGEKGNEVSSVDSGKKKYKIPSADIVRVPNNTPPNVASPVLSADPTLLGGIFNPGNTSYAHLEENPDVDVSFDVDKIFTMHLAILGSTGSGKSYFIKKLLLECLYEKVQKDMLDERIIIIDTHGEYEEFFSDNKIYYKNLLEEGAENQPEVTAHYIDNVEDIFDLFDSVSRSQKDIIAKAFESTAADRSRERLIEELKSHLT